jgi:hypothetical protein
VWWDQFTLEEDGDPYERLWWHFLEKDFPEWGRFWAHHIVPLTNRIDDRFKARDRAKLFTRNDKRIDKRIEALAMANYSVFYYLARSCAIVSSEPHLFTEDAFIFLRATTENIAAFLDRFTNRLTKPLNIDKDDVPKWIDIKNTETAKNILEYRDTFVHSARLGRNPNLTGEFIPKPSHLSQAKHSWSYVQNLPEDEFVDARKYLRELQTNLMKEINPVWKRITDLMDERRVSDTYLTLYRLEKDASGRFRPIKDSLKSPHP